MIVPGERTTEFWMAIGVKILLLIAGALGIIDPNTVALGVSATAGSYAVGRGLAKQGG